MTKSNNYALTGAKLFGAILLPLLIGISSSFLTSNAMMQFHFLNKPPLSPPAWLFPAAWTILYVLMGFASFLVLQTAGDRTIKMRGLIFYAIQLVFNFFWTILFFNGQMYLVSFIWLVMMTALIVLAAIDFFRINRLAGLMMVPYILWCCFAGYLNMGIYILSRTPSIMPRIG